MPFTYAARHNDHLIAKVGDNLKAVKSASITVYLAGTSTPATIYSNATKTVLNTTGAVTTDDTGNWSAFLEPGDYYFKYKDISYPTFTVSDAPTESESDLAAHAAATSGVHGVPSGEVIATRTWVSANAPTGGTEWYETTGAPANGTGQDGDYAIDTAAGVIYGPKAAGVWPAGISIKGAQGEPGPAGSLADTNPADLGTRAPGVATTGSRSDHVHAFPTASQVGAASVAGPFAPATTGATAAARFVGGTTSGAPTTGAFNNGDYVFSQDARIHGRTASGWELIGPLSNTAPADIGNTAAVGTSTAAARADHVHSNAGLVRSSQIGAANGVASLGNDTKVPYWQIVYGTSSFSAANGADERIVNAQSTTQKGAANGYASLDANTRVPSAQLGTGTASASTYLRGDGTWTATKTVIASTTAPTDTTAIWIDIN